LIYMCLLFYINIIAKSNYWSRTCIYEILYDGWLALFLLGESHGKPIVNHGSKNFFIGFNVDHHKMSNKFNNNNNNNNNI